MRHKTILKNVLILGMSGIIAKSFDFCFRAYYSRVLGAEGMGLLSLGFSIHAVMLTFATAGLGVAVSKITSEYMERKNSAAVKSCMHGAIFGVTVLSLFIMLATFSLSPFIAEKILGDRRLTASLCTLAPSILFMGISYCLKGCFYAARRVVPPAFSEILEQCVKFLSIKLLLKLLLPYGTEYACAAIFGGITIGELSSCAYLTFFYLRHEKSDFGIEDCKNTVLGKRELICKILGISIPSMVTSLCCSFLRMQEEVLIISALKRGGMAHSNAVRTLGIFHGMAMPLLVLPLNLAGSVMSLLVPEISRAGVIGKARLKKVTSKIYKAGILAGLIVSAVFLNLGERITELFYGSKEASALVIMLAPLCPVMFIDSLSCSVLNGLGKQLRILIISLADFALRLSIIYIAFPSGTNVAFALMVTASNCFTCALSLFGALKYIGIKLTKPSKYGIVNVSEYTVRR